MTAWRTNDESARTTGGAAHRPARHHPAGPAGRLATAVDIAGHADATVHIPVPVDPVDDSSAPRRRWGAVVAWEDGPAPLPSRADVGPRAGGPLTAAVVAPAPRGRRRASRRARNVTTRAAALIAAAAFVVGGAVGCGRRPGRDTTRDVRSRNELRSGRGQLVGFGNDQQHVTRQTGTPSS